MMFQHSHVFDKYQHLFNKTFYKLLITCVWNRHWSFLCVSKKMKPVWNWFKIISKYKMYMKTKYHFHSNLISYYFEIKIPWYKGECTCCFLRFTRLIKYLPTLHRVNEKSFQNRLHNFYSTSLGLDIAVSWKKDTWMQGFSFDDNIILTWKIQFVIYY